jgi:hypothetical protein
MLHQWRWLEMDSSSSNTELACVKQSPSRSPAASLPGEGSTWKIGIGMYQPTCVYAGIKKDI